MLPLDGHTRDFYDVLHVVIDNLLDDLFNFLDSRFCVFFGEQRGFLLGFLLNLLDGALLDDVHHLGLLEVFLCMYQRLAYCGE